MHPDERDISGPFRAFPRKGSGQIRPLLMAAFGVRSKGDASAKAKRAVAELVILVTPKPLVEATELVKERLRHRAVPRQHVAIGKPMSGLPHAFENRVPPAPKRDPEQIAARIERWRQETDD